MVSSEQLGFHDHIPGGGKTGLDTLGLPESAVKIAPVLVPPNQAFHDNTMGSNGCFRLNHVVIMASAAESGKIILDEKLADQAFSLTTMA